MDDAKTELLDVPEGWEETADTALFHLRYVFDGDCKFEVVERSPRQTHIIVRGRRAPYADDMDAKIRAAVVTWPIIRQLGTLTFQFIEVPEPKLYTPGDIIFNRGTCYQCVSFGQSDETVPNDAYERHPLGGG